MLRRILTIIFIIVSSFVLARMIYPVSRAFLLRTGIVQVQINIAGTGSMYPTFPKGTSGDDVVNAKEIVAWPQMKQYPSGFDLLGLHIFPYKLSHGDIVEIENEKTKQLSKDKYGEEAGFVKRVIALGGDTVEIRDGFVYLNGSILEEPYTAKPRSTYGGKAIPECQKINVPQNKAVVLGDNRKASQDSRFELGLVDLASINYVLPWSEQSQYRKLWRADSGNDAKLAHTTTLSADEFINLLNKKRAGENLKPLKYVTLLSNSARRRGKTMIDTDDFSTEATKSGIDMSKATKEAGYRNILLSEASTIGFYEAEELLDNFLEFPETKQILFSSKYQDIGLSPVLGDLNGCPIQVVVLHLGGYVPPNYTKQNIGSWQKLVDDLTAIIPTWEKLRDVSGIDTDKLNRLIDITNNRKSSAERILKRMTANEWLTDEEEKLALDDKTKSEEIQNLISELNKQ